RRVERFVDRERIEHLVDGRACRQRRGALPERALHADPAGGLRDLLVAGGEHPGAHADPAAGAVYRTAVAQRLDVAVVPLAEGVAADPVEVAAQRAGQVEPGLVLRIGLEILGRISVARAIDREGGAGQQAGQHTGGQSWNGLHGTSSLTLWRRQRPSRQRRPLSGVTAARCRKTPRPRPGGRNHAAGTSGSGILEPADSGVCGSQYPGRPDLGRRPGPGRLGPLPATGDFRSKHLLQCPRTTVVAPPRPRKSGAAGWNGSVRPSPASPAPAKTWSNCCAIPIPTA